MHRQSAGRRRSVAGRGFDLPDERALARRSRQVPAGGGARRLVEEGPRRALPGPVGRDGNRGERPARHRARRGARGGRGYRGRQGLSAFGGRGHREGRVGRRRIVVAELTYRDAVAAGIAQEMARDESVVFLGEDIGAAGGVFKTTLGLLERFGPRRVRDTPISEQAIIGAAMGAAMTGLRPIAEIMFSDFFAVCWDMIANEIAKTRYMTAGQIALPLVIRTANGYGSRFGAQHSQSVENWAMAIPGLNLDVKGLLAAAVRDPDPVIFFEHKGLYSTKGEVPDGEIVDRLGTAKVVRQGEDVTIVALAAMVPKSLQAAERLAAEDGISATVVDVRSLVPLDTKTIFEEVRKTGRLYTVEENPRLCGWGAEIASLVAEECFYDLDGPIVRITTPHVPLPAADLLEDNAVPTVDRIVETVRRNAG
ncbi:MAG: alpha-ketoacid dehydrogenase subunit beta [Deltaproteobacteria bacterium]|nr:MAG: alpha-ketoacid dehydrogenase subunit beta [Deltaproteobacteria bacterium]